MRTKTARYVEVLVGRVPALILGLVILVGGAIPATASLEAARTLAAQGDPAGALRLVEQQLANDPDLPEGLFLKGVLLVELRRADEARDIFEQLIQLEPELPEPYNNLAVIQAAAGNYEAAVETLRRSLQTHASYRTAYENLTKIYSQLASEAYSQALETEPVENPAVVELVLLGNLGEFVGVRSEPDETPAAETQLAATEPSAVAAQPPGMTAPESAPEPAVEEPAVEIEAEPAQAAAMDAPLEPAAEAEAPPMAAPGPTVDSIAPFVESWRSAWQEQRVDDYLASYSDDFRPADGSSRAAWARNRGARLTAPEFIRVTLAFLDEPQIDGDQARIRFLQSYESNTFQDRVTKTLTLGWEDGGWKILAEQAD